MRPDAKVGVSVDPIDVPAGMKMAESIGYGDDKAQIVTEAALYRHKRAEEASAQRLWLSEYPNDLTSWTMILAAAIAAGAAAIPQGAPQGVGAPEVDDV